MKGGINWSLTVSAAIIALILGCARQAAPSGGKKDVTPPRVVKSIPAAGARNFKGKKIVITFDEFVALDNMTEKFMISPPLNKKPDIQLKGKNLIIEFFEKLKDSTTYTLYFQDAIKDLNEGNKLLNYQFVFSTGNVLDSLSATGNVLDALTLEPPQNALILLHRHLTDSAFSRDLPDYITLADVNGGFRINNINAGTYNLFALVEKNNNKKFDLADEEIGCLNKNIIITPEKNYIPVIVKKDTGKIKLQIKKTQEIPMIDGEYKLFMFTEAPKKHYMTSSARKSMYLLTYSLAIKEDMDKFTFKIPGYSTQSYFIEKNQTQDSLYVWLTDSLLYSQQQFSTIVTSPFTDTLSVTKIKTDTVPMRFTPPKALRGKIKEKHTFKTNIIGSTISPVQDLAISTDTPLRPPDTTRIRLFETTKTGKSRVPFFVRKDSLSSRQYFMKAKFKEGSAYQLFTDSAAFVSIYGVATDSVTHKFSVRTKDSYGQVSLNITNIKGSTIIQLLDTREKVLAEKRIFKNQKVEFPMLEKGNYRFRAIYDLNNDGKWTTGNYYLKEQPEPVSYFPKELEVKVNFWNEEDWDAGIMNQKEQKLKSKGNRNN